MTDEECAWPGCVKRRGDLPLCEAHLLIAHKHVENRHSPSPIAQAHPARPRDTSRSVVYYLRVGELVKIGYASNLARRLAAYPPDAQLLATEPGGRELESQRHREMRHHLRMGREWFVPAQPLLDHIASVIERCGPPKVIQEPTQRRHSKQPKQPVTVRHANESGAN